jgi:uncharacterized protein YbjT (DUF2867 family)
MVLITGALGNLGRLVLDEVRQSGARCRALYRNDKDAAKAPPGIEVALGDFADRGSLVPALAGINLVYLVCSPIPALSELEGNVIDACVEAGVEHVVLNSALGAADYPKSFPHWHRIVEDKLKASGLGYTIFRPNGFMQNILAYLAPSIRAQDAFYAAMGDAKISFLDARDIAAAIGAALASPGAHRSRIYELNGPEAVTYAELAERISRVAGRPIRYVDIPEAAQRKSMLELGMPEWQVDALMDLQRYYTGGQGGEVTPVLEQLIGRPPIRLDAFLAEFRDSFAKS